MKKIILLLFVPLFLLITGCDSDETINAPIPFAEYTVVRGELRTGEVFDGVTLTRTVPLDEIYSTESGEITDAVAYIRVNDVQVIPLLYDSAGVYKTTYPLIIKEGNRYELFADAGGREVYASTIAPAIPDPNEVKFNADNYLQCNIRSNSGEVYGAAWALSNDGLETMSRAEDFHSIIDPDSEFPITVPVRTDEIPDEYSVYPFRNRLYIQVFSFDNEYLDYFQTKANSRIVENTFSQGGNPVVWNVHGENVIGMFVAMAESELVRAF